MEQIFCGPIFSINFKFETKLKTFLYTTLKLQFRFKLKIDRENGAAKWGMLIAKQSHGNGRSLHGCLTNQQTNQVVKKGHFSGNRGYYIQLWTYLDTRLSDTWAAKQDLHRITPGIHLIQLFTYLLYTDIFVAGNKFLMRLKLSH